MRPNVLDCGHWGTIIDLRRSQMMVDIGHHQILPQDHICTALSSTKKRLKVVEVIAAALAVNNKSTCIVSTSKR